MRFTQNLPLMVRFPGEEGGEQRDGMLYGSVEGECLIAGGFGEEEFAVGQELIARTVLQGHVIGFWATVKQKMEGVGTMYLLSYPSQVESLDLRKSPRLNVFIPAEFEIHGQGKEYKKQNFRGVLVNLAGEGCCFSSGKGLPEKFQCKFTFSLPGSGESLTLSGKVIRNCVENEDMAKLGVEFSRGRTDKAATDQVKAWISSNQPFAI